MALLLLQPIDAGAITLAAGSETHDLADIDPAAWWEQAAWVPQRILTRGGSIRSHIDPAGSLTEVELAAFATQTGLDVALADLPEAWDTPLAEAAGGLSSGLSVGQTHRLELTRALARGARLVVLDEPTAHLAPQDEDLIIMAMRALADSGAAVVVIAHRPATLAAADVVLQVATAPVTPDPKPVVS